MRILVTGASGFIGTHVINHLIECGHEVIATSTNKKKAQEKDWFDKVTFIEHTINEEQTTIDLFKLFHEPETMIHCAWEGLPNYESRDHVKNFRSHLLFIKNLVSSGLKDFTVTGTCLEYGSRSGYLREDFPCKPKAYYGIVKRAICEELEKDCNATFKWCRLFYTFGKGQNEKSLIPSIDRAVKFKQDKFTVADCSRDFLPVEDVAKHICNIAVQKRVLGVINICSGRNIRVIDFATAYCLKMGYSIRLKSGYPNTPYEAENYFGDITKLNKVYEN
jgi:dTDP-6-deoxy-L-talose 4-dehydrogenase (NAD+)